MRHVPGEHPYRFLCTLPSGIPDQPDSFADWSIAFQSPRTTQGVRLLRVCTRCQGVDPAGAHTKGGASSPISPKLLDRT